MTDTPDNKKAVEEVEKNEDFLGYDVYADTLWKRVTLALDKDKHGKAPLGDDPLVIGIFGEWGAGKSKLLQMMLSRAKEQSKRDIAERKLAAISEQPLTVTVPVYFQPWKYEHERHLHVPLAVHVADALQEAWKCLPTDIEQLRKYVSKAGDTAAVIEEKLSKAKAVFEQSKKLWDASLGALKSRAGAVVAGTTDIMLTSVGVPPVISLARQKIIDATTFDSHAEADDSEKTEEDPSSANTKESAEKTAGLPKAPWAWKDDGLGFYRMHRQLKALTRPKLDQKILDKAGIKATFGIEFDLRINFVVFIDDLDRCLPEKAVEALELIKTVFCLESFAFVLALDEEVVERGIGHRYQAYVLKDRKPEMPITGFEYLEKIVHLPFRLPALTRAQASDFVRQYEKEREADGSKRWFAPVLPKQEDDAGNKAGEALQMERRLAARPEHMDLLALALDGFDDVFVPRKLVRMVELMHQIAAVAHERGKPLGWGAGAVDVRVVLVIMLIQLFQPELYRLMRRRKTAFSSLLVAFSAGSSDELDTADVSDHNLRKWALYQQGDNLENVTEASQNMAAEQVRLPLVEQIGQYRRAQRHGFNVLKLMQALAKSMDASSSQPINLEIRPYFSLLGQEASLVQVKSQIIDGNVSVPAIAHVSQAQSSRGAGQVSGSDSSLLDTRPRHAPRDLQALFRSLISPDQAVQANLAGENDLPEGSVLEAKAAQELLEKTKDWLGKHQDPRQATEISIQRKAKETLMRGLQILAPYVSYSDGNDFWDLVKDAEHGGNLGESLQNLAQLKAREAWADLRSTLGQDDRFDAAKPWICTQRFNGHTQEQEPIPGYVRIPKGEFQIGHADQSDNTPKQIKIADDFYIARHLTTVAQYARFVQEEGYRSEELWDAQGWRWLQGQWGSEIEDQVWRAHLDSRSPELRKQPMRWHEQLPHAARPVHGVSWFEARAYARWLQTQLESEQGLPSGYEARLPTEAQWERAARALANGKAHEHPWVWGADGTSPELKANIDDSKIGRAGIVGIFPANPLGLKDMAGNLWEWQDNLFDHDRTLIRQRIARNQLLKTEKEWQNSDRPSLRGGSWFYSSDLAQASFRFRFLPVSWVGLVGFRVVLSLA